MRRHAAMFFVVTLALTLLGCAARPEQASGLFELTLLHSNDTHSYLAGRDTHGNACFASADCVGGVARMSTALTQERAKGGNVLAVDAGDRFQGTLFYTVNKMLPYDAMTLGNHEFDEGCAVTADFVRAHAFPVLAANLEPLPGCPLYGQAFKPYLVRTFTTAKGSVKVGVVGLANPHVGTLGAACAQTRFIDSTQALKKAVAELEGQGVRHIVAVTHLGLPEDRQLARTVDGVDIIAGGHTHSYLGKDSSEGPYPIVERSPSGQPVLVVTAKFATEYLGALNVIFDAQGVPQSWDGAARRMDQTVTPDPTVEKKVATYVAALDAFRSVTLGSHDVEFADGMKACRQGDCLAGMVVTDAMLEYARPYGAVAALCNGGGLRAPLQRGELNQGDVLAVLPFANTVVIRRYTGAQLLAALEHGASGENGISPHLLQVSGLRYRFDPARPVGTRLISAELMEKNGEAVKISPGQIYTVALIEYLARGGDAFAMLTKGASVSAPDSLDVDILGAYIQQHSPLRRPHSGRIILPISDKQQY